MWLPVFYGELKLASAFAPRDWHVHEMLYGYLPAIVTGFLFTAIPNWTGRLPLQGTPLATLVAVWIAGRLAVTFSAGIGWWAAMLVDASFLLLVAAAATREIAAGRNWKQSQRRRAGAWCCWPAMSPFISKRISAAPPISASASALPWSCC